MPSVSLWTLPGPGDSSAPTDLRGLGGRFQVGGQLCPVLSLEGPAGVGGALRPPWAGEGQPSPRSLLPREVCDPPSVGTCGGAALQKGLATPTLPVLALAPMPPTEYSFRE